MCGTCKLNRMGTDNHPSSTNHNVNSASGSAHRESAMAAHQHVILTGDFLPAHFRTESYALAKDVVNYICKHENAQPAPNKTAIIMRSLVDDALQNRLDMMRDLVQKLDIQTREQLNLLNNIAAEMFNDEVVNWGRVVTLHAFCGYLARWCEERHITDCGDDIGAILGSIVVNKLGLWIVANGGWVSFLLRLYLIQVNLVSFSNICSIFNIFHILVLE